MCEHCESFDIEVPIHGPQQLRRVAGKIRAAVSAGHLLSRDVDPDHAPFSQAPFTALDLDDTIPDVIHYRFECASCGAQFGLVVETYHGAGGKWYKL